MPRPRRLPNRIATIAACGLAVGAAIVVASQGACVTTPPPDLPGESPRPTILHDSVVPPVNEPLVTWPLQGFSVPVQLDDPDEQFCWAVFIDYNPYGISGTGLVASPTCEVAPPSDVDGGVVLVSFTLEPGAVDLGVCHQIEFIVAKQFEVDNHTPIQPPGGDDVTWNYVPGGGPDCPLYEAGAFSDGAVPVADASADALPFVPTSPSDGATASDDAGSP
jgi:hypothetical protein